MTLRNINLSIYQSSYLTFFLQSRARNTLAALRFHFDLFPIMPTPPYCIILPFLLGNKYTYFRAFFTFLGILLLAMICKPVSCSLQKIQSIFFQISRSPFKVWKGVSYYIEEYFKEFILCIVKPVTSSRRTILVILSSYILVVYYVKF